MKIKNKSINPQLTSNHDKKYCPVLGLSLKSSNNVNRIGGNDYKLFIGYEVINYHG